MCKNCQGARPGAAGAVPEAATQTAADPPVKAIVEPGFHTTINVRLLPARQVVIGDPKPGCQPRGGAPGHLPLPAPMPDGLPGRLLAANKSVVAWLTKDPANAELFLNDPVTALGRAGAELNRADAKALSRSHGQVREQAVLPPGAVVKKLTVRAAARGKVGAQLPDRPTPSASGSGAGCGC